MITQVSGCDCYIHGGFRSIGDRMKEANKMLGMNKYAASRSGSWYVVGREGWKGIAVS